MAKNSSEDAAPRGLKQTLLELRDLNQDGKIQIGELVDQLAERGQMLVTLILGLPFMLPIPLPGLSIALGIIIAATGVAAALNRKPWMPERWRVLNVPPQILRQVGKFGIAASDKLEKFVKPRGQLYVNHPGFKRLTGVLIAICGTLLALPLPPGTNFPPGIAIILLSLANLEEDAVVMILGYLAFIGNIVFFVILFAFGYEGIKQLLQYLAI